MSYKRIYKLNERKKQYKETLFLLKKESVAQKDELGFRKKDYVEVQKIHGVIQRSQTQQISFKGEESNPFYTGYFLPEFILETKNVADYRIKYIRPHETLILKIREYNQNLFLRGKRDHIQLELILEKKYEGEI